MPLVIGYQRVAQDLAVFTRHLAGAMAAKAPLAEVVSTFEAEADTRVMRRAVRDVALKLQSGAALSEALEAHKNVFPASYISVIRMGEESETLPKVVSHLATSMEEGILLYENFRRATIYPTILLAILFLFVAFVTAKLMPRIQDISMQLSIDMPGQSLMPSVMPLAIITLLLVCLLWVLGAGAGLTWNSFRYGKWILSVPLVGAALRLAETSRFVRHLGLMLESRIPISEAVGLLADSSNNGYVREALRDFEQRLSRGEPLKEVLASEPLFPPALSALVGSAQERGQLTETLEALSTFYRERARHALQVIREFFEPILLLLVGLIVIWIALTLYIPIVTLEVGVPYVVR